MFFVYVSHHSLTLRIISEMLTDFGFPSFAFLHWQPNYFFSGLLLQYKLTKLKKKKKKYEMLLVSYPCFGTVLALWDVFLHLVHLQFMREIPDQQLLWMRYKERESDRLCQISFLFCSFLFSYSLSSQPSQSLLASALFCMDQ